MRGIANTEKRRAIFDHYRNTSDLLILQETHSTPEVEKIWTNEWGGEAFFAHGTSQARGIAVFMTKGLRKQTRNVYNCSEGRTIMFDLIEGGTTITIVAVYAPNSDTPTFYQNIQQKLRDRQEHKIILGDFNLTLDVEIDRKNTYNNNNKALSIVEDMMDEFCLIDIWRAQNEDKREYSWFKQGQIFKASRIDFALVSLGLDQRIKNIFYKPGIMTDHRALFMFIDIYEVIRGGGFWKLNTQLLAKNEYIKCIRREIELTVSACSTKNPQEKWELVKSRVKKTSQDFAKRNVSQQKILIGNLTELVNDYESRLPLPQKEDEEWQKAKSELESATLDRTKSIMFRSKVKWYEEGEKNTKYFFSLEKARYNAKTCYKMLDEQLEEVTDPQQILKLQKVFYQELYQKDDHVSFTLQNTHRILVPEDIKEQQEHQISLELLQKRN